MIDFYQCVDDTMPKIWSFCIEYCKIFMLFSSVSINGIDWPGTRVICEAGKSNGIFWIDPSSIIVRPRIWLSSPKYYKTEEHEWKGSISPNRNAQNGENSNLMFTRQRSSFFIRIHIHNGGCIVRAFARIRIRVILVRIWRMIETSDQHTVHSIQWSSIAVCGFVRGWGIFVHRIVITVIKCFRAWTAISARLEV